MSAAQSGFATLLRLGQPKRSPPPVLVPLVHVRPKRSVVGVVAAYAIVGRRPLDPKRAVLIDRVTLPPRDARVGPVLLSRAVDTFRLQPLEPACGQLIAEHVSRVRILPHQCRDLVFGQGKGVTIQRGLSRRCSLTGLKHQRGDRRGCGSRKRIQQAASYTS